MLRLLAALCIAGLGSATMGAGASADIQIGTTKRPTPIRSWGGVAAFSLYDEASGSYRLAVSRNGGPSVILPVVPQPTAFDLDVGPDSAGSPVVVYSRCATTGRRPRGCDLYRYSLSAGNESKIVGASTQSASETDPTIWRGRLAWARLRDAGRRRTRIYTRRLDAPRSRPPRRMRSIPSSLCGGDGCVVNELELRGRWLAVNGGYPGPVCNNGRLQLDSLAGRVIRIADTTCGLDGQTLLGVSFDQHNLYFARFCQVGACDARTGAFRYVIGPALYSAARPGQRLTGFSYDTGGRAYEVLAPDAANGYCGNFAEETPVPMEPPDCLIVRTDPLTFKRVRALR